MNDEKLIELVRKFEFIYNLKHPKYMDTPKKDLAWKEIGGQLNQSAVACKQRWQCLRDAYRRARNKKKLKKGHAKSFKLWKYENEMAFVAPFLIARKAHDSVDNMSDDELSDNADYNYTTEYNIVENVKSDFEVDETHAYYSDANSTTISIQGPLKNELKQEINTMNPKAVKRTVVENEPSASITSMPKLQEDQNKFEPPRGHDELDRFFLNISDTVKKLSPYIQAVLKNKIFSMVSEMEIQQLAPSSSTSFTFGASSSQTTMPTSSHNEIDTTESENKYKILLHHQLGD